MDYCHAPEVTPGIDPPAPGEMLYRRDQAKYCKSLVVAVHGMGDQVRNDFVQNIAELFARHYEKTTGVKNQATRLPLGLWDAGKADPHEDHAIGFIPKDKDAWLAKFAFAEVYWAQIPRKLDVEGYRLEESKKWAGSVVERLCQRHDVVRNFSPDGPQLAATVVEEIAETLRILSRVLALAQKAGFIKLNLADLLNKYLGDVQQVADFHGQRTLIRKQFLLRMQNVAAKSPAADIHIIAHSEGTVVAFLGLLYALRIETETDSKIPGLDLSWIKRVRSFTTVGSPIDKHLILWPEIWYRLCHDTTWRTFEVPIRWRNYYDLADPVGFRLDSARDQLKAWKCNAFEFEDSHDHGFRRYPLPGVAHIDYFGDTELFSHIINEAIEPDGKPQKPETTFRGRLSVPAPFVIVGLLHAAAVFILHKALVGDKGDIACRGEHLHFLTGSWGILGCTAILLGTTVLARVLRISHDFGARCKAFVAYIAAVVIYWFSAGCYSTEIGQRMGSEFVAHLFNYRDDQLILARIAFILLSVAVVVFARLIDSYSLKNRRPPIWGLRWLMILGGGGITTILVMPRLADSSPGHSAGALVSAAAAFLYLWWLGILLFDLSFVWKTYINTTNTVFDKLRKKLNKPDPAKIDPK